jgi:quinolinate synthase
MLWQPSLTDEYTRASADDLNARIRRCKDELGEALVILGHHYQRDEVIAHADLTGDSLKLSQLAAQRRGRATGASTWSSAACISWPRPPTCSRPNRWTSSCPISRPGARWLTWPTTTMRSTRGTRSTRSWGTPAGRAGSSRSRTSTQRPPSRPSSARQRRRLLHQLQRGSRLRVGPRGRNRAGQARRGSSRSCSCPISTSGATLRSSSASTWRASRVSTTRKPGARGRPTGRGDARTARSEQVILWAGHCSVHKLFRPEHCDEIRAFNEAHPDQAPWTIIVHPECRKEVVDKSDESGLDRAHHQDGPCAEPGTRWAVGTEHHLVNRLSHEMAERGIEVQGAQ